MSSMRLASKSAQAEPDEALVRIFHQGFVKLSLSGWEK